jgi:peptidoglycan/LPS O-acetylase OafA/YrhL
MKRLEYLDALRGLAAMAVVIYHFINWQWADQISTKAASIFFNGADAVSFFFVLSGFVLSYKFLQYSAELHIPKFIYKRVLRLYPAFIVTVLLNYLYWNRASLDLSILTDIFYYNKQQLWEELLMLRNKHKFYIPGWTMGVEMAFSLLIPFLIVLARKDIKFIKYLLPISIFIGHKYLSIFLFHFLLGILLAYYFPKIQAFKFRESKFYKYRYLTPPLLLLLFSARHFDNIYSFGRIYDTITGLLAVDFFHLSAFASFIIVFAVINNSKAQRFLENRLFLFIGKISYSIYLSHWLVVIFVMNNWEDWTQISSDSRVVFAVMLIATIMATVVFATILYYAVEKVFLNISYRSAQRLFPKKEI